MVTGDKGYSPGKVRKIRAARTAVARAANLLRTRNGGSLRAPLATYGWYGRYNRRGRRELKTIDTSLGINIVSTGAVTCLNLIGQGSDYNQRDGRIVQLKSILMRFSVFPNTTTGSLNAGDTARVLVVYDKQTNGTALAVANILQALDPHAAMNLNYRDRWVVLIDKQIGLGAATYSSGALVNGSPFSRTYNIYKKLNMDQVFQSTGNTLADISTGAIWLYTISMAANATTLYGYSRIRFTDN